MRWVGLIQLQKLVAASPLNLSGSFIPAALGSWQNSLPGLKSSAWTYPRAALAVVFECGGDSCALLACTVLLGIVTTIPVCRFSGPAANGGAPAADSAHAWST